LDGAINLIANVPATPGQPDLASGSDLGQLNNDNITSDNTPTFTGTGATSGHTMRIYSDGVLVGSGPVDGSGNWSVTSSALSHGVRQITARAFNGTVESSASTALPVTIDTIAPTAGSPGYNYLTSPHSAGLVFSENVGWSVVNGDFVVDNLTNPGVVTHSATYNGGTNSIGMTFPGNAVLPDARYRLTVLGAGGGIQDVAGNSMASNFTFDFFFLMGDANHDASVNLLDFNIVAANFGQSPRDFGQGDFTYNFSVTLADFDILAARFGAVLAGPDALALQPRGSVFSSTRIDSDKREGAIDDLLA
jgi:hypothetical protein